MFPGKKEGFALMYVLILIAVLGVFALAAAKMTQLNIAFYQRTEENESSIYYAEAGINRYLYFINQNDEFWKTDRQKEVFGEEGSEKDISFEDGFYRLEVTPPGEDTDGNIIVQSTGWVGESKSTTIRAEFHKRTFMDYVYGTNEEISSVTGKEIWWADGDEVFGKLHTNGTLHFGEGVPVFHDEVTYSTGKKYASGSNPLFQKGDPVKTVPMEIPVSNESLIGEAGDYSYKGRTCILIDGDELHIRNQDNEVVTRPLPPNGVIYVDSIGGAHDKFNINSGNVFISGELDGQLTVAARNNIYITGYNPTKWGNPAELTGDDLTGGVFYSNPPGSGICNDVLGLIAEENIIILHYGWINEFGGGYHSYDVSLDNITIHAAMLTLNTSFQFEKYSSGNPKNTIHFLGSMFQINRGAVGSFNTNTGDQLSGYKKDYRYDSRLRYLTPPHFLEPENSGWRIESWEVVNQ